MTLRLTIDADTQRVILDGAAKPIRFKGQWVEFYALLALRRTSGLERERFTSADEVGRCALWRGKKPGSVRGVVARHLQRLDERGGNGLLQHQGRTKAWRLAVDPDCIAFLPSREAVAQWMAHQTWPVSVDAGEIDELRTLVDATIMLESGEVEAASEMLERSQPEDETRLHRDLDAWRAVLTGRVTQRFDQPDQDVLEPLAEKWKDSPDPVGKAAYVRLLALQDFDQRFEQPDRALRSLDKLAARLHARGDIASLAPVWNVMGVLARRSKNPSLGAEYHVRAAAVFGLLGDLHSLQAAVFDLAICCADLLAEQGRPPDALVLDLVDACLAICSQFGVGADSAQAEIAGCRWAVRVGDLERARKYLNAAEELLNKLPSTFDQACFIWARGELDSLSPGRPGANPLRDIKAAKRMFAEVGDTYMVAKIKKTLKALGYEEEE